MWSRAPIALLLIALTAAVYWEARDHEFLYYDDTVYVTENPVVRGGLSWSGVRRAFAEPAFGNWNPLTSISFQLDRSLWGLDPRAFHATSIALHALSAALLFLALASMTGALGPSAFVAAVFAVHPLHVESVAWISERKDALSGVFWMLTLLAYAHYGRRESPLRGLWVLLALCGGLLAKPMLVTLPCVLLLLDYWPLGRLGTEGRKRLDPRLLRRRAVEKLPLFAAVAAISVVTLAVQRSAGAMEGNLLIPLGLRLMNALDAYVAYLSDSFVPVGLAAYYPHPLGTLSLAGTVGCGLLLAAITAGAALHARSRPHLIVGWLWFVGTLVPVIGLVQVGDQARADRYMYFPLIGLSIALAWEVHAFARGRRARERVAVAAGCALVAALSAASWQQNRHWRDTLALFEHAVSVQPGSPRVLEALGNELMRGGRAADAAERFAAAIDLAPDGGSPRIGLADALVAQGRVAEALPLFERGLELDPDHARGHGNLGLALLQVERPGDAGPHFERALVLYESAGRLAPRGGRPHFGLASVARSEGDLDGAISHYEEALRLDPTLSPARVELAFALLLAGRHAEAGPHLRRAAAEHPGSAQLEAALGILAEGEGHPGPAAVHYREALRLAPGLPVAANNLAWLLATHPDADLRDPEEAVRLAEGAVRGGRATAGLLDTLAASYAAAGRFEDAVRVGERAAQMADREKRPEIEARLALYRAGRAYVPSAP